MFVSFICINLIHTTVVKIAFNYYSQILKVFIRQPNQHKWLKSIHKEILSNFPQDSLASLFFVSGFLLCLRKTVLVFQTYFLLSCSSCNLLWSSWPFLSSFLNFLIQCYNIWVDLFSWHQQYLYFFFSLLIPLSLFYPNYGKCNFRFLILWVTQYEHINEKILNI